MGTVIAMKTLIFKFLERWYLITAGVSSKMNPGRPWILVGFQAIEERKILSRLRVCRETNKNDVEYLHILAAIR